MNRALVGCCWLLLLLGGWPAAAASPLESATLEGAQEAQARPPRVVLYVLFDTLGAGHISHLGYDRATTPHLDALARDGVAFHQAISPAPYALASIPSLMTGRYPDRHGMISTKTKLPHSETTLAEYLKEAGYRTVAFSSVYNGGPNYQADQGFERFVEMYLGEGPEGSRRLQFRGQTCHFPQPTEYVAPVAEELDRLADGERLYLFIHLLQPHEPYDPPLEFLERFRDERFPGPYDPADRSKLRTSEMGDSPPQSLVEQVIHLYDANVACADAGLGALLAQLRQRGLYEEALIVATGNHGEAFWQHGMHGHGVELHEELMRVPAVLKLPKSDAKRGLRRDQLVSNLDFVPTILERVGHLEDESSFDGRSLLPLLLEEQSPSRHDFLFLRSEPKPGIRRQIGLRRADSKVIVTLGGDEESPSIAGIAYFDLSKDPGEENDLASSMVETAKQAARQALDHYEALRRSRD